MYSAIVFLPLFGAIIAGIITLYGAWQRTSVAESHAGGHHGHGHGHAHHSHDVEDEQEEADGHGDHEPAERRARRAGDRSPRGFLVIAAILSWIAFVRVGFGTSTSGSCVHLDAVGRPQGRLGAAHRLR
jgi:NADH-quinone oxidoreductase subunit L